MGLSPVAESRVYFLIVVLGLLIAVASLDSELRLNGCGTGVSLFLDMRDLPGPIGLSNRLKPMWFSSVVGRKA